MTLQKFSSDHAPSKSPFDQSPPLLLVSQRVSDHRRALVSGQLGNGATEKKGAQKCTCNLANYTICQFIGLEFQQSLIGFTNGSSQYGTAAKD
jgi:hypothetical protein